ncbi:GNAT family N-acetyltransferase [Spirochaeta cellobiosiphila]|uniref:GNAT family N-acetyltransferase n=1 Tax=Spirochaeta cellobiosiphila TaxID=504483 RepID=UPI00041D4F57|nr:GNAT family N-acetyltransferase [Spirochaeta cellobiosiphila]
MWYKVDASLKNQLQQQLLSNESRYIMAVDYFIQNDKHYKDFWIDDEGSCLLLTQDGRLLPYFRSISDYNFELPKKILQKKSQIKAVAGIEKDVLKINEIIKPQHFVNQYYYLKTKEELDSYYCEQVRIIEEWEAEQIHYLQWLYEKEELHIPGYYYSQEISLKVFKKSLAQYTHLLYEDKDTPLAKGNINSRGWNWNQLGGIYTHYNHRNRGLGAIIVKSLLSLSKEDNKSVVLFVNKKNLCANYLYNNLKFTHNDNFAISYYN